MRREECRDIRLAWLYGRTQPAMRISAAGKKVSLKSKVGSVWTACQSVLLPKQPSHRTTRSVSPTGQPLWAISSRSSPSSPLPPPLSPCPLTPSVVTAPSAFLSFSSYSTYFQSALIGVHQLIPPDVVSYDAALAAIAGCCDRCIYFPGRRCHRCIYCVFCNPTVSVSYDANSNDVSSF